MKNSIYFLFLLYSSFCFAQEIPTDLEKAISLSKEGKWEEAENLYDQLLIQHKRSS